MRPAGRSVRFLASVTDEREALLALANGADVIDGKDPARGALGALPAQAIARIVAVVDGRRPVSATIGDLVKPDDIARAVEVVAATGVDLVKIGLFSNATAGAVIERLAAGSVAPARLVGLLLADRQPDFGIVPMLGAAGFAGVMIDTSDKSAGSLGDHISLTGLAGFIALGRAHGLSVGLAGALRMPHIAALLNLAPDILGFRGALCSGGRRTAALDASAIRAVRAAIPQAISEPIEKALAS
ncbi:MAG: (5-formylfuran-3-yl)methyl phosphate synthase [Hyphomicrobium sp.]